MSGRTKTTCKPQPFLRWAGSKRQVVPLLAQFWRPTFDRYVEPFMGSACLFFAVSPQRAVLGDLNSELVKVFRAVRTRPTELARELHQLPKGRRAFYQLRGRDPMTMQPVASAARFIFLNRFCFNGLFRTNLKGQFNVPYAPSKTGDLPNTEELQAASHALRCASIRTGDFEDVLADVKANDFIYLDPPFAVSNRRVFRQYGPQTFGISDLRRLAAALTDLDHKGATFVLSYAYCREALEAFGAWPKRRILVHRNIAGFARCRRTATELLFSNAYGRQEGKSWK